MWKRREAVSGVWLEVLGHERKSFGTFNNNDQ